MEIAKVALGTLAVAPDIMYGAISEANSALEEAISRSDLTKDSIRLALDGEADGSRVRVLLNAAYESLKLWMAEHEGLEKADYVNVRSEMQLVGDGQGGVAWVSNKNVKKFREKAGG